MFRNLKVLEQPPREFRAWRAQHASNTLDLSYILVYDLSPAL